jgi:pSer/pThr/pTyr-binding forkhead associated (FHA) protein
MDVRLIVDQGPVRTRTVRLRAADTTVGRQEGCGLRIPSGTVSRRHCRLRFRDGYLTVEDLGSANGTFVNGHRVAGKEVLRPGDRLAIGPLVFVVEYRLTPAAIDHLLRAENAAEEVEEFVEALPLDGEPETGPVDLAPFAGEPEVAAEGEAEEVVLLDDAEPWHLPEAEELRDILSKLDDK